MSNLARAHMGASRRRLLDLTDFLNDVLNNVFGSARRAIIRADERDEARLLAKELQDDPDYLAYARKRVEAARSGDVEPEHFPPGHRALLRSVSR